MRNEIVIITLQPLSKPSDSPEIGVVEKRESFRVHEILLQSDTNIE